MGLTGNRFYHQIGPFEERLIKEQFAKVSTSLRKQGRDGQCPPLELGEGRGRADLVGLCWPRVLIWGPAIR